MKNKYLVWCGFLILAAVMVTIYVYPQLPAQVPVHWDMQGQVNQYGPRWSMIVLGPGLMAAIALLFAVLPRLSPKRFEIVSFQATYWYLMFATVAMTGYFYLVTLWAIMAGSIDMNRAIFGGVAALFALIGNVMGKVRRNSWIGIRTPWTRASERVWYASHRIAGKSMVSTALLCLVGIFAGMPVWANLFLLLMGVFIPAVYSLYYYKKLEQRGELESR
jgi:uncharacterized membrane protein